MNKSAVEELTTTKTKPVVEELKKSLANSYALYLKTHNYHWNVTGPEFYSLHLMFEKQYDDLAEAVDGLAERIRALGEKVPGTFTAFSKLSKIEDGDENLSSKEMIKQLADDQVILIKTLEKTLEAAEKINDTVTVDLITQRMFVHEKNAWMLNSSLK